MSNPKQNKTKTKKLKLSNHLITKITRKWITFSQGWKIDMVESSKITKEDCMTYAMM